MTQQRKYICAVQTPSMSLIHHFVKHELSGCCVGKWRHMKTEHKVGYLFSRYFSLRVPTLQPVFRGARPIPIRTMALRNIRDRSIYNGYSSEAPGIQRPK